MQSMLKDRGKEEGMKTNSKKLEEIRKENPFRVPENYFEHFNQEIMNRLPEKDFFVPRTVSLWDKVKPWVYMAAMFLGLYFTIQFLTTKTGTQQTPSAAIQQPLIAPQANQYWSNASVTEDEFYQYLEDQLVEDNYYDYIYEEMSTATNM